MATPTAAHIMLYAQRGRSCPAAGDRAGQHVAEIACYVRHDAETVRQRFEALILGAASDTLSGQVV